MVTAFVMIHCEAQRISDVAQAVAGDITVSPIRLSRLVDVKVEHTSPGKGGEIQLTDAIRLLIHRGRKVYGLRMRAGEVRHDIGSFESYFRAFIDFAVDDPELGAEFRQYIREVMQRYGMTEGS